MHNKFYDDIKKIDKFIRIENPTIDDAKELCKYLKFENYSKYVFQELRNPLWVELFQKIDFFSVVPDPIEDSENPGYFSFPRWWAGEYLAKLASQYPGIVRDVALDLETENSRAIKTMLDAILHIPPDLASQTVTSFERWSRTRFVHAMIIAYEMGHVMDYLSREGYFEAALEILRVITEPYPIKEQYREGTILAGSRHDIYWLRKALFESTTLLVTENSLGVVDVIESRLVESIDMEVHPEVYDEDDFKNHSYWRLNIDPDLDSDYRQDIKNMLVNVMLKAYYQACDRQLPEVSTYIEKYLVSEYAIFRRVAVHLLRLFGDQFTDLVERAYLLNKEEGKLAFRSEFERFLESQFGNFSTEIQHEILQDIYNAKNEDWFVERMDRLIEANPDRFVGKSREEKEESYIAEIRFRELYRFQNFLSGEYLDDFMRWEKEYKSPEPIIEGVVTVTEDDGPPLPFTEESVGDYSVEEIVRVLIDYSPPPDSGMRFETRTRLGRVLEVDVAKRCDEYSINTLLFKDEEIRFVYHSFLFSGLENAIKAEKRFDMDAILDLAEYLVQLDEDPFEKQDYEPSLESAKRAIAGFLEAFLRTKEPYLSGEQVEQIGKILKGLLWIEEANLELRKEIDVPSGFDPRTMSLGDDPATQSLNSIRGQAMHALIMFALYNSRKLKYAEGESYTPVLHPLVKENLEKKLSKPDCYSLALAFEKSPA